MIEEDFYWYCLNNIPGVGNAKIKKLLTIFENPVELFKSNKKVFEQITWITKENVACIKRLPDDSEFFDSYINLKKKGISFTYPGKSDYPKRLLEIYDYPYCLYYKGRLPSDEIPSVAVVGSRNCTQYGVTVAKEFSWQLAAMGIQMISGMALGVDTAGHRGSLENAGYTCAVSGCGVDICYPAANIELYTQIEQRGGIVSEYAVGTPPLPGQFPVRNRIISGLSDAVIVVEARKKSGSLITADQALEQNRDVYVVPGRIGDVLSEGCNELIKIGAQIITCAQDVLNTTSIMNKIDNLSQIQKGKNIKKENSVLASRKNMLYSVLNLYPKSINTIIEETGMTIAQVSGLLLELEIEGLVFEVSKNCYVRMHL